MTVFIGSSPKDGVLATHCFSVVAQPDACVLPRVIEVFAKRGYVLNQCHAILTGESDPELHIDLQVACLNQNQADHLAAQLRQLVYVSLVLTSDKRELQLAG